MCSMRAPLDSDTVGDPLLRAGTPGESRAVAAWLAAWAAEPHPADPEDLTPAALLVEAGEILELLGDHAAALEMYRRATVAEGRVRSDPRALMHRALVALGELAEAGQLADEVRRTLSTDVEACVVIGENYEKAGDLTQSHRWMNLALRRLQRKAQTEEDWSVDLLLLPVIRRRVRRALGLPTDCCDRLADRFDAVADDVSD